MNWFLNLSWFFKSVIAMVTFAMNAVILVNLIKKGVTIYFIMLLMVIMALPVLTYIVYKSGSGVAPVSFGIILWIILAGLLSFLGNITQFIAGADAPNAGIAFAIIACQVIIITLFSRFFMGGSLTTAQVIGIGLCMAGVLVINLIG